MKPIYTIAVDFDGTLVENGFPDIENAIPKIETVNHLLNHIDVLSGFYSVKLILWTCRENICSMNSDGKIEHHNYLNDAIKYCEQNLNLKLDAVNENPFSEWGQKYPNLVRKIYADEYWDDKAVSV